jgi:N-methylhydantoinase A
MRFVGQGAETDLVIDPKPFTQWTRQEIRDRFDAEYKRLYGRTYPETPVEFVTFKVRTTLPTPPFVMPALTSDTARLSDCIKGTRKAFSVLQKAYIDFTVYDRSKLFAGANFTGPAIVEERESTIVMGEDAAATVDDKGFVWIRIGEEK